MHIATTDRGRGRFDTGAVHGWVVRHSTTVPLTLFSGVGCRAKPAWCIALHCLPSAASGTRGSSSRGQARRSELQRKHAETSNGDGDSRPVHTPARTHDHTDARAHTRTHKHAQTRRIVRARTHARTHRAEHQANSRSAHAAQTLECMRSAPNAPGARYAMHCAIMPPIDAPITAARPAQCAVARALECAGHSHCRLSAALESAHAQRQMRADGGPPILRWSSSARASAAMSCSVYLRIARLRASVPTRCTSDARRG